MCKEEVSHEHQQSSSLVQEEPQPPQIKVELEELMEDGSTLTLLAVKSEGDVENRETEAVASTSTEHMKTQTDVEQYFPTFFMLGHSFHSGGESRNTPVKLARLVVIAHHSGRHQMDTRLLVERQYLCLHCCAIPAGPRDNIHSEIY